MNDQALVVSLGDRGLVVLSGCGHAGIVNSVRYARKLTRNDAVAAIIGGFHLTGRCSSRSSTHVRRARSVVAVAPGARPLHGLGEPSTDL
jgi:metal-dependent hydrolase (beta-lactamase superfamily II)